MKKVIELPEWFRLLPDNAALSPKDVMELFGFRSYRSLTLDSFPKANGQQSCHAKYKKVIRPTWSKSILIYEINKRNENLLNKLK